MYYLVQSFVPLLSYTPVCLLQQSTTPFAARAPPIYPPSCHSQPLTSACRMPQQGGALFVQTSDLTLTSCTMRGCYISGPDPAVDTFSVSHGAAVYALESALVMSDTTILNSSGPTGDDGEGESIYNLASAGDTGATYLLPAPAGRYATYALHPAHMHTCA